MENRESVYAGWNPQRGNRLSGVILRYEQKSLEHVHFKLRSNGVKRARSPETRAIAGLWSVWADAHDLEFKSLFGWQPKGLPLSLHQKRYRLPDTRHFLMILFGGNSLCQR